MQRDISAILARSARKSIEIVSVSVEYSIHVGVPTANGSEFIIGIVKLIFVLSIVVSSFQELLRCLD